MSWEERVARGYEAAVEELIDPDRFDVPKVDTDVLLRYYPSLEIPGAPPNGRSEWIYRMINTKRPLEEKMALFWHQVLATGNSKIDNPNEMTAQVNMFREKGMGNYRELLVEVAKSPAMIYWLDNNENHKDEPNENWGRELLELFSMGVGNYTEQDVFEASRAFTGWTISQRIPRLPLARFYWNFEYHAEDHDDSEKTFLGHRGNFNGDDIIDIIVRQPATARFVARHLYNFFVADEEQVPAWQINPPLDPGGDQHNRGRLHKLGLRHEVDAAGAVQLGLFQRRVDQVAEGEEPGRGSGGDNEAGGGLPVPEAGTAGHRRGARVPGAGDNEPAQR